MIYFHDIFKGVVCRPAMSTIYDFMIGIIIWTQSGYDKKISLIMYSDQSNRKGTIWIPTFLKT